MVSQNFEGYCNSFLHFQITVFQQGIIAQPRKIDTVTEYDAFIGATAYSIFPPSVITEKTTVLVGQDILASVSPFSIVLDEGTWQPERLAELLMSVTEQNGVVTVRVKFQ
jgi:hypothetical protein